MRANVCELPILLRKLMKKEETIRLPLRLLVPSCIPEREPVTSFTSTWNYSVREI